MKVSFKNARLPATLLLAIAAAGAGCGTPFPAPEASDVAWAKTRYPMATMASLTEGRKLFLGRCASCHVLPEPTSHTPDTWPASVKGMSDEAKLTEAEQIYVTSYLSAMSARAPEK